MTKQEIYDKVRAHLLAQGKKAMDGKTCCYRAPDGCKCAIGAIITDPCYDLGIEGVVPVVRPRYQGEALLREVLECSGVPTDSDTIPFLRKLQDIHDDRQPGEWPALLTMLAVDEGLRP